MKLDNAKNVTRTRKNDIRLSAIEERFVALKATILMLLNDMAIARVKSGRGDWMRTRGKRERSEVKESTSQTTSGQKRSEVVQSMCAVAPRLLASAAA